MNKKQDQTDVTHSEEVEEIVGRVPSWVLRFGTLLILFVIVIIMIISWIIKYPEVIDTSFRLTSINTPKQLKTKVDGRVVRIFVKDGAQVKKDQVLAYMESSADPEEVQKLSDLMDKIKNDSLHSQILHMGESLKKIKNIGQLQASFQPLMQSYLEYNSSLSRGYYKARMQLLKNQYELLKNLRDKLKEQSEEYNHDYTIAEERFNVLKRLTEKKVMAPLDLKDEESKLIEKKIRINESESQYLHGVESEMDKQMEINQLEKQLIDQKNAFYEAANSVRSEIESWNILYRIVAPFEGKVSFMSFLQEKQSVVTGQTLFSIAPLNLGIVGEVRIPQNNLGRVKIGQEVIIRFNSYPYQEFGYIKGKVEFISEVPSADSSFEAKVGLPNGLVSSFNKKLAYREGMIASGEIVTDDLRLLQRFFRSFFRIYQQR